MLRPTHCVKQRERSQTPINDDDEGLSGSPAQPNLSVPSSPGRSESPSSHVGVKREHHQVSDEEVFEVHVAKAQRTSKLTSRPKAADYDIADREIILSAANTYRALLASQGAFPMSSEELELVKKAWKRALDENEIKVMALTPDIVRIVSNFLIPSPSLPYLFITDKLLKVKARGSQARGEAKAKTASLVEALYGFDSGRSKKTMAENRKKAEELKTDKGFLFEVRVFFF
jgi:Domain of unknown function (DUF6532)